MPDLSEFRSDWPRRRHFLPLVAIGVLGLVLSVASWFAVSAWEKRLADESFRNVAGDYAAVMQNGLDQHLGKIRAVGALYDSSNEVDRAEFDHFTSRILADDRTKMWVLWVPRVEQNQRTAFEREAREAGLTNYAIKLWAPNGSPMQAAETRAEYFPILYSSGNAQWVLGMDLFAEPASGGAPSSARATAAPWRSPTA